MSETSSFETNDKTLPSLENGKLAPKVRSTDATQIIIVDQGLSFPLLPFLVGSVSFPPLTYSKVQIHATLNLAFQPK
jgi:hypothetical protein